MINEEYPRQSTNPARDLYKYWYSIVRYNAPHLLRPQGDDEPTWRNEAFHFDRYSIELWVDRDTITEEGRKPALYIKGVMKIWPNGHFSVLQPLYKWGRAHLDTYERYTFLRWGWVNREKAMWVQDTPRRGRWAANRIYPEANAWERRTPYLPLRGERLFDPNTIFRLKFTTAWTIVPVGIDDPENVWTPQQHREMLNDARQVIDHRYGIANRRYDWWKRRAELKAIREGQAPKPRKPISALDRVNVTDLIMQGMTVYEPKVGPRGVLLPRQMPLPLETGKEVVLVGRDHMEPRSVDE